MIKKAVALAILLLVTLFIKAQDIPNSGFEDWNSYRGANYEVPVGWTTNDVLTSKINPKYKGSCTSKTSEAHSGNYAIKMQVVIDHGDTANGCIYSVNNIDSVILLDEGKANAGFKYFLHATSLNGYYKFTSATASLDSAFFGVTLSKWNKGTHKRDILVNTIFLIGQNSPHYLPFVVPFKYRTQQENPDTALIVIGIQGPRGQPAHQGTTLFIDDIGFAAKQPTKKD
jgi:hypothetical protein